jgi:succinyl-CoA synthetase alpha subunit
MAKNRNDLCHNPVQIAEETFLIDAQATQNAQGAIKYGTNIVGGVSRSRKDPSSSNSANPDGSRPHPDPALADLPVYTTVRKAVTALSPDATAVFIPAAQAAGAIIEAIEAEVPLIVSVAEHIPVHDMLRVQEVLRTQSRSRLVGPNCPGIISPLRQCKVGIMPHAQYAPGAVGIASKSGTLSYEAVGGITGAELGQSLCIGVGGDLLPGTSLVDATRALIDDPDTKGIVLLGEIGGDAEIQAAELIREYRDGEIRAGRKPKPFVGMVTGLTAPEGRTMGHAGAISGGGVSVTAEEKVRALERAGVIVPVHPGQIGGVMKELLAGLGGPVPGC